MEQNNDETVVVFRVWNRGGEVVALFPELPGSPDPLTCLSYERSGQHGPAITTIVRGSTRPATTSEYTPLLRELESIGYTLIVQDKFPSDSHLSRRRSLAAHWQ